MICLLDAQKTITDKGGTMRLGAQPTQAGARQRRRRRCYGKTEISERHRHRYEFNNRYRDQFAAHGMRFSGTSPDGSLVEVIELPEHPWFLAVQYHPEFKSKPTAPQPLFAGFIGAAVARNKSRGERGGGEEDGQQRECQQSHRQHAEQPISRELGVAMADEKKIIIDEDWKSQVQAEKEAAAKQRTVGSRASGRVGRPNLPTAADPPMPPASFEMLLTTLATEALVALGQVPHPLTGKAEAAAQSGQVSDRYARRAAAEDRRAISRRPSSS